MPVAVNFDDARFIHMLQQSSDYTAQLKKKLAAAGRWQTVASGQTRGFTAACHTLVPLATQHATDNQPSCPWLKTYKHKLQVCQPPHLPDIKPVNRSFGQRVQCILDGGLAAAKHEGSFKPAVFFHCNQSFDADWCVPVAVCLLWLYVQVCLLPLHPLPQSWAGQVACPTPWSGLLLLTQSCSRHRPRR